MVRALIFSLLLFSYFSNAAECKNYAATSIPESTPVDKFLVSEQVLIDTRTGLMWKRCIVGEEVVSNECVGERIELAWSDMLAYAADFDYQGFDDWRVPNVKEFASILEDQCLRPALNFSLFPVGDFQVWSSTQWSTDSVAPTFTFVWRFMSSGAMLFESAITPLPFFVVRDVREGELLHE